MRATPRSQEDHPQRLAERRADAVCLRFEEAWKSGQRPRIAEYLERVTGSERAVLRELLALELTHRSQRGEEPTPEEHRRQFRGDGKLIDAMFRALPPSLSQTSLINTPQRGSRAAIRAMAHRQYRSRSRCSGRDVGRGRPRVSPGSSRAARRLISSPTLC